MPEKIYVRELPVFLSFCLTPNRFTVYLIFPFKNKIKKQIKASSKLLKKNELNSIAKAKLKEVTKKAEKDWQENLDEYRSADDRVINEGKTLNELRKKASKLGIRTSLLGSKIKQTGEHLYDKYRLLTTDHQILERDSETKSFGLKKAPDFERRYIPKRYGVAYNGL